MAFLTEDELQARERVRTRSEGCADESTVEKESDWDGKSACSEGPKVREPRRPERDAGAKFGQAMEQKALHGSFYASPSSAVIQAGRDTQQQEKQQQQQQPVYIVVGDPICAATAAAQLWQQLGMAIPGSPAAEVKKPRAVRSEQQRKQTQPKQAAPPQKLRAPCGSQAAVGHAAERSSNVAAQMRRGKECKPKTTLTKQKVLEADIAAQAIAAAVQAAAAAPVSGAAPSMRNTSQPAAFEADMRQPAALEEDILEAAPEPCKDILEAAPEPCKDILEAAPEPCKEVLRMPELAVEAARKQSCEEFDTDDMRGRRSSRGSYRMLFDSNEAAGRQVAFQIGHRRSTSEFFDISDEREVVDPEADVNLDTGFCSTVSEQETLMHGVLKCHAEPVTPSFEKRSVLFAPQIVVYGCNEDKHRGRTMTTDTVETGGRTAISGNGNESDDEMASDSEEESSGSSSSGSSSSSCLDDSSDQERTREEYARKKDKKVARSAVEKANMWRFVQRQDVQEVLHTAYIERAPQPLPQEMQQRNSFQEMRQSNSFPVSHTHLRPARTLQRAVSQFQPRTRDSASPQVPVRRNSNGEPPQSWVQRKRLGRQASRSRHAAPHTPAEKRLLSEARKKRANSVCRPLMLRTHVRRQELRYGHIMKTTSSGGRDVACGQAQPDTDHLMLTKAQTIENRMAVRDEAHNFQRPYAHVLESMEDRICFSRPRRSHTLDENELENVVATTTI